MRSPEAAISKFDMHLHTGASIDVKKKRQTNEAIIKKAIKRGLDGFIVSDHDTVKGYKPLAEQARDHGLIVIPGVEVTCFPMLDTNRVFSIPRLKPITKRLIKPHYPHLLVAGVTLESIPTLKTANDVAKWGHDQDGKNIAAHPKDNGGLTSMSKSEVYALAELGLLDGIEVTSSHKGEIRPHIQKWCRELGVAEIGGSDAHVPDLIGLGGTIFNREFSNWQQVVSNIKAGNTKAYVSDEFEVYRRKQKKSGSVKGLVDQAWDIWCEHVA